MCEMGQEKKRGCHSILERPRGQVRARLRSHSLPDATWTGDVRDRGRTGQGTSESRRVGPASGVRVCASGPRAGGLLLWEGTRSQTLGVTAEPSEVSSQGWPAVVMCLHSPLQVLRTGAPFLFPQMWVSQARQSHRSHLCIACAHRHTQEAHRCTHRCTHALTHTKQPPTLQMGCGACSLPLGEGATGLSKVKARLQEGSWSSGAPPPKRPPRAEKS